MDSTSHPAAPSDLPAPAAERGSGESAAAAPGRSESNAPAEVPLDSGPTPFFPVPRHRRPSDAELAEGGALANARFIRFTIAITILFVLAMTALIWYRWYPVALPTSSIVFIGDASLDGGVATVSQNGQECYSITLEKKDDYTATVWLSPGRYDLVVKQKDRSIIQRATIGVSQGQRVVDTLSAKPAARPTPDGGPLTQPGS